MVTIWTKRIHALNKSAQWRIFHNFVSNFSNHYYLFSTSVSKKQYVLDFLSGSMYKENVFFSANQKMKQYLDKSFTVQKKE